MAVIYEKGLIKAMKAEVKKKDGYTVALDGGICTITGENWFATMAADDMSKELKSVIMLHAGFLPEPGEAIQIQKKVVQKAILGSATELASRVQESYAIERSRGHRHKVQLCRIQLDGNMLMQGEDMRIVAVSQDDALPLLFTDMMYLTAGCLYSQAGFESVGVRRLKTPDSAKACIAHLEAMQWVPGADGVVEDEDDAE